MTRTDNNAATPAFDAWKVVYCFWPICDIDGTWLILTDAERRPRQGGDYEYRALLPSL
jgi:hypothetical protein